VNNRKVLDGVMDAIGLGGDENAGKRLTVLRAIDKLDRLGADGVVQLLGAGRKDESGDFTKGAGLSAEQCSAVLHSLESSVTGDIGMPEGAMAIVDTPSGQIPSGEELRIRGLFELFEIQKLVRAAGYSSDRIKIDPSVVRGLEYYTGPVYEVELTFSTDGADGSPRFGSVGGGGRYDGLVSRFMGQPVPATGFSIGVSRLQAALAYLGKVESKAEFGPVVVTVFDRDRVADYQKMVAQLRNAGIRAELYLGNPKNFGNQLKYADRRNAPCVVIQGGDEKAKNEVTIKDLVLGAELAKLEKTRDDYRQKQGDAQTSVPEGELVSAVRAVLTRHKVA
jgi:histidyl-tRNA synthetase